MNSTQKPWLSAYPEGVPAEIDTHAYSSVVDLMQESFRQYGDRTAFSFLGRGLSYKELDRLSQVFAAYLQSLGLVFGDRVAIMLPNVLQYPIAVAAVLRAGFVVVNINPLYTARELEAQLKDSDAKAIVVLENFGATLQECLTRTPVKHVVLCAMGDRLGLLKGMLVNHVVRKVKKMVPAFELPTAVRFNDALAAGERCTLTSPEIHGDDLAVLQYTGGTTGVAKGAELLHRNVMANMLQASAWFQPALKRIPSHEIPTFICPLPLYHIFAFTLNIMACMRMGGCSVLIPNPRDLPAVFKEISKHRFHVFPAVNTLFNALANHPDFNKVDWSHLVVSVGGGMAVQGPVAKLWLEKTGCPICEGYGLSETSPSASCNPTTSTEFTGTIGVPLPSTYLRLLDDDGQDVPVGQPGEIAVKGPQVMAGYWQLGSDPRFILLALASGIPFNGMFLYVLSAPVFLGEHLGLAPSQLVWIRSSRSADALWAAEKVRLDALAAAAKGCTRHESPAAGAPAAAKVRPSKVAGSVAEVIAVPSDSRVKV